MKDKKTAYQDKIQKKIEEKRRSMGIEKNIKYEIKIRIKSHSPIDGKGVFGKAFPHSEPPQIKFEIYPLELTDDEINEVITDELLHVKNPGLKQYKEQELTEREEWKKVYETYLDT